MTAVGEVLGEKTFIGFTSDHGSQWPFGKWNCYEGGVRVPLLVSWPGVVKPGSRTKAMVSWIDLLPTLLTVAGGSGPGIDGRSSSTCSTASRPSTAMRSSRRTAAMETGTSIRSGRFESATGSTSGISIRSSRSPATSTCRTKAGKRSFRLPGRGGEDRSEGGRDREAVSRAPDGRTVQRKPARASNSR